MKTITQERILKAIAKTCECIDNKPEFQIIQTLAYVGLKNACSETNSISDKDKLNLAYNGFSDPAQVFKRLSVCDIDDSVDNTEALKRAWFSSFDRTLKRHWKRQEKITNLQEKYNVSGLKLESICLGNVCFQYHEQVHELGLITNDSKILENEKILIARKYCNAVHKYNMTLWRWENEAKDWTQSSCKQLLTDSLVMSHVSSCYERKFYTNQKELKEKGFTSLKTTLNSLDDKITWEFHLTLDDANCSDESDNSLWFCANLGDEKPGY